MTHACDIAIIGAGAAGIGAARRLAGRGLSVVVLEALPRLGGRASTVLMSGLPLDLGCGWLHSADRNPWTRIAEAAGFVVDRRRSAWDQQFGDLGAPPAEWEAAGAAFDAWSQRLLEYPPASDRAIDAVAPGERWLAYLQALSGYISGDELERISAADYAAYDSASTALNWRLPAGYGTLIASRFPADVALHLATPLERLDINGPAVELVTPRGTLRCRAAILTVSTHMLAGDAIRWPAALDPWRAAAAHLPLGCNEKLFLEIIGPSPFEAETHVQGDLHDPASGTYYIRPFGFPVIECFLGGAGARRVRDEGTPVAFAHAIDQLAALFGGEVRRALRPALASSWGATPSIGGGYSHALPGHRSARARLASPYEDRLFFAGEATHPTDFSTAHGALLSGIRAADEVAEAFSRER
ncbi:flavin monoamine oxidase family protein [Ancylobacter sp. SL191]|uniref:flavin monoamine oxidase family protein n=1 Tax=Ancylobacter sp. SL191 TaxID=2995166 RepID=UPI002270D002|nr:FAD-dependent oxidoreductase [Ancylobacter sp. SL191]WAC27985.1 FAD-dependent oxidoreductase [Ancylobacter sp. SL191]